MQECTFLIPHRQEIVKRYGRPLVAFGAVLFFNVWVAVHLIGRHFALGGTGKKLDHLDRQLKGDGRVERLAEQLEEKR